MALSEAPMSTFPETPLPSYDEFEQAANYPDQEVEEVSEEEVLQTATPSSTFLEDMLIDEFAAAITSPMTAAVWQGAVTRKSLPLPRAGSADNAAIRILDFSSVSLRLRSSSLNSISRVSESWRSFWTAARVSL